MNRAANDRYEIYYTEKIWEMIPSIYRFEDGQGDNPGVLRSIVHVIASQAAILRRSQDRLWEDQFIDACDDWAVSYIGDLLGTRLLSAQLPRGRRIDVAKTIYYRRNAGTPRVLEELINDISGWDGKLVEGFQRLFRFRHGLDPTPSRFAGMLTGTMPGGFPDLRNAAGSELSDGPFEEYFHLPDFRKPRGLDGRYGIQKLIFYLYRLQAYPIEDADPFPMGDGTRFVFDPSGRNIPLFSKRNRADDVNRWNQWHSAFEWELPMPIRCRLLNHVEYLITPEDVNDLVLNHGLTTPAKTELTTLLGHLFKSESQLFDRMIPFANRAELQSAAIFLPLLQLSIVSRCGKNQLIPDSVSVSVGSPLVPIPKEELIGAFLPDPSWNTSPLPKSAAVDTVQGRVKMINASASQGVSVTYHYGFSGPVGAGSYDRKEVEDSEPTQVVIPGVGTLDSSEMVSTGVVEIADDTTYVISQDNLNIVDYTLQSANQCRPYLLMPSDWTLSSGTNNNSKLILDGLWIASPGNQLFEIKLKGDFESVIIRHCTFDPGGDTNALGQTIQPVSLVIEGSVENLCIEYSILGPVVTSSTGLIQEKVTIHDSIIQSVTANPALQIESGMTELCHVTVFGEVSVHRLYASGTIITGKTWVTDNQTGCFRFSAAPDTSISRLPRPYECFLFSKEERHWFVSRRYGQPGYAQLSETAPVRMRERADNGSEMGAFNFLMNPVKLNGLKIKIEEFMPFGLIPAFINQT